MNLFMLSPPSLWDFFCIASLIGIWPRFIEPAWIRTSYITCKIASLPSPLKGLKIAQFSDLHFSSSMSDNFLKKVFRKIERLEPDLILFTGDFLCYGKMEEQDRLHAFLNKLQAPHGCFAVLGNHDYAACVSVNEKGDYDVIDPATTPLKKAFNRLGKPVAEVTGHMTDRAKNTPLHDALIGLLKKTPFKLLHNETATLQIGDAKLNLTGLGEYMMARALPSEAFAKYDKRFPGIILLHNPDGAPCLKEFPGDIILSGHTHGGQINLPWIWKKFTVLENRKFTKGLHPAGDKWIYINRGIGSAFPFRCFSPPELLLLTLECRT